MIARPSSRRAIVAAAVALVGPAAAWAQDLTPAAYVPAPKGASFLSLAATYSDGDLSFDPSLPIDESSARIWTTTLTYGRALGLLGRSANVTLTLPYIDGGLEGLHLGQPVATSRSGQGDASARLAVNLLGAPAMTPPEFAAFRGRTLLGASLAIQGPTGEYDSAKLVNVGTNRWSAKPEVGFVHVVRRWSFDFYLSASFYSTNDEYFGGTTREQDPIYTTQAHVRFLIRRTLWVAVDGNYWSGGRTTVAGVERDDRQENSRIGLTVAWQASRHHGLRFAASRGAVTRIGGDFDSLGLSYSYSWLDSKPASGAAPPGGPPEQRGRRGPVPG